MKGDLDEDLLDLLTALLDLGGELRPLLGGDGARDHGPVDSAGAPEGGAGGDEHVRDVLVLGNEGQVEEDLEGLSVSRENDDLGGSAVQGLGGLVGTWGERKGG